MEAYSGKRWNHGRGLPSEGACRGGSYGFKAETCGLENGWQIAVLVEPGTQTERVVEVEPHHVGLKNGIRVVNHLAQEPHERRDFARGATERHRRLVSFIGRHGEDGLLDPVLVHGLEERRRRLIHCIVNWRL